MAVAVKTNGGAQAIVDAGTCMLLARTHDDTHAVPELTTLYVFEYMLVTVVSHTGLVHEVTIVVTILLSTGNVVVV